jgi:hypothetical protein
MQHPPSFDYEVSGQARYSEESPQVDSYGPPLILELCTTPGLKEEEIAAFDERGITFQAQKAAY